MFNPINGMKANQAINNLNLSIEMKLRELRRERGLMTVRIEETRLHDKEAHEAYKEHLASIDAMIESIMASRSYVLDNRGTIIKNAMF